MPHPRGYPASIIPSSRSATSPTKLTEDGERRKPPFGDWLWPPVRPSSLQPRRGDVRRLLWRPLTQPQASSPPLGGPVEGTCFPPGDTHGFFWLQTPSRAGIPG